VDGEEDMLLLLETTYYKSTVNGKKVDDAVEIPHKPLLGVDSDDNTSVLMLETTRAEGATNSVVDNGTWEPMYRDFIQLATTMRYPDGADPHYHATLCKKLTTYFWDGTTLFRRTKTNLCVVPRIEQRASVVREAHETFAH
jgi:hypothetical protein